MRVQARTRERDQQSTSRGLLPSELRVNPGLATMQRVLAADRLSETSRQRDVNHDVDATAWEIFLSLKGD